MNKKLKCLRSDLFILLTVFLLGPWMLTPSPLFAEAEEGAPDASAFENQAEKSLNQQETDVEPDQPSEPPSSNETTSPVESNE